MDVQLAIKNKAEYMQTCIHEMTLWEKEIKKKEQLLLDSSEPEQNKNIPLVRNQIKRMKNEELEQNSIDQEKREQSLLEKERGNEFVKQQKWSEAIFHYTEAIDCYALDSTFYTNRALCFLKLKKWKEAETDCSTALQIDPTYYKAHFRRALALKELNQFREAKSDLLDILKLDPENISARNELEKIEKLKPDLESNETTTLNIDLPTDKKKLAVLEKEKGNNFVKLKDWNSAIKCYTEACNLYSQDTSFYLNRALCFLKTNEFHKTILDCCRVLELDPNNVKAYYRRALAHQQLNNFSKAHEDLLTAFQLDPSNEDIQRMLNKFENKLGVIAKDYEEKEEDKNLTNSVEIIDKPDLKNVNFKRITGDRFIKRGGYFLSPLNKSAHMLSKKPLKRINVRDKNDDEAYSLERTLDEFHALKSISNELRPSDCSADRKSNGNLEVETKENSLSDKPEEFSIPKTTIQFLSTWNNLNAKSAQQFMYLKKIGGNNFPVIFKSSLESCLFSEILDVLNLFCTEENEPVYQFLDGLSQVKRFNALLLFATPEDNKNIEDLLKKCEKMSDITKEEFEALKSRYYYQ